MSQWIVVDDTDSAITYTADPATPWSAVNNSIPGTVDLKNAIFQTGHVLSSNGSLSFSFTGTDIEVFGVSSKLSSETDDESELSWTCSVDNITIPSNRAALNEFPWMSYCNEAGMNNESHILHVNVSMKQGNQFWLDYIRYVPLPGSPQQNQTILVESSDPAIQYGTDWDTLGTAKVTLQDSDMPPDTDNMNFTFSGTGITWYSLTLQAIMQTDNQLTGAFPQKAGSALIALDGVQQNITIPTNGSSDDPSYDMPLFHYDGLDPSTEHFLTATYLPDKNRIRTPPLTLDFLLVQTGPEPASSIPPSASAGISGAAPGPTSPAQALSEKSHPVRASTIAGAVLGPLVFVLATLLAICYWRRRRQRARTARRAMTHRAAKLAFPREREGRGGAPSLDDDDSQPTDSESYAMHTSESAHTYARAGQASPGAMVGSRFVEDTGAAAAVVATAQRPFTARRHSVDFPWETMPAPVPVPAPTSAAAQSVLVDYSGREALQGPSSTSSVTNPFRRMNLASPSNDSFGTLSQATSNPFRGGSLTPSAQRGG